MLLAYLYLSMLIFDPLKKEKEKKIIASTTVEAVIASMIKNDFKTF